MGCIRNVCIRVSGDSARRVGDLRSVSAAARVALSSSTLGAAGGGWRVVKIWSSTCGACIRDLSPLVDLSRQFQGRVAIYAPDESTSAGANYLRLRGLTVPLIRADASQQSDFVSGGVPRTAVFNPENRYIVLDESRWVVDSAYWLAHGSPRSTGQCG
jgi:hypothetical protein